MYEASGISLLLVLTDRCTEYCVARERHECQLYLTIEDIDHTKTKAHHQQTNGIYERFHRTIQEEFYAVAFRKKIYNTLEELQEDLDKWLDYYNNERTHTGKYCLGKHHLKHVTRDYILQKREWYPLYTKELYLFHRQMKRKRALLGSNSTEIV